VKIGFVHLAKTIAIATVIALTPIVALAATCQEDVAKIDAALLAKKDLAADVRQQAEDMRNQAVQLCGAGNEDEGLAVTAEAKALLETE
jgi:hypothetical protein